MAMSQEAANEIPSLENYLPGLRTIITISPLLGLLGTIAGMIASFKEVARSGLSSPYGRHGRRQRGTGFDGHRHRHCRHRLIFHNYFGNLVKRFVEDIEYYGSELTNFLTGRVA